MAAAFDLLVIDDEPVILQVARKILTAEGLRPDLAPDGEAALAKVANHRYRAVLCDLVLPGIGGFELVARIRDSLPGAPIILITGYATVENATAGFSRGIFDFIPKPFDDMELLGVVQRALDFATAPAPDDPRPGVDDSESRIFSLGGHAWAALQVDGSAQIGMGETFTSFKEDFEHPELPAIGELLLQGNQCARWTTRGRLVHRLWTPLSGRVTETSTRPFLDPKPRAAGAKRHDWVVRLIPSNPDPELSQLVQH